MPNRIIKETIRTSDTVASLTDFEFRLWIGLIVSADDAGRGDARPAIIKGSCFPLRERLTVKEIDTALHGLAAKGCISLYEVDGKPYFWFPSWSKHQRIRECRTKFPDPPASPQVAASCGELPRVAALIQSNPIQSESISESESNKGACSSPLDMALDEFAKMRKAMRKPLTQRARELTIRELEKLAPGDEATQIAIINQSIQRGWQGVFPLNGGSNKGGNIFFDIAKEEGLM